MTSYNQVAAESLEKSANIYSSDNIIVDSDEIDEVFDNKINKQEQLKSTTGRNKHESADASTDKFKLDFNRISTDKGGNENSIVHVGGNGKEIRRNIVCSPKGKIIRENLNLDNKSFYDYQSPKKKAASENMLEYMDNFGVGFALPSIYVQDSKIFPGDPRYNLQLVNFAFPESDEFEVAIHNLDGSHSRSTFSKINAHLSNGLVLRLLVREHSTLKQVDEVSLYQKSAIIKFNQDGSLFAIYYHETQIIKIFEVEKIENFIQQIKDLESNKLDYLVEYNGMEQDLSFIAKTEFDINKRFFIGYGGQSVFLLNFDTKLGKVYQINTRIYQEVRDVSFASEDDFQYECYIACRRKNFNQICIFDFVEDLNYRDEHQKMNHGQKLLSQAVLNFDRDIPDDYIVMISHDFKQVVFACANFENSIINRLNGYYNQVKLKGLRNSQIQYVQRDYEEGGFYLLIFEEFDQYITVSHTNKLVKNICFSRSIEPGIIGIFDFHTMNALEQAQLDGVTREIRIISRKDQEFQLDKAIFQEDLETNPLFLEKQRIGEVDKTIPEKVCVQKNIEIFNYIFSPLRATSIGWPYIVISGLGNIILIMNAFEKRVVRRVQVAEKTAKVNISETFLTETKDLFVVVQDQSIYKLFMIDLDESNEYEQDGEVDPSQQYRMYPLFEYSEDQVKKKNLKQIHVRGSSRKEPIDLNQKLQVFFLHGEQLYNWVQINNQSNLNYVCRCTSKLQPMSDHKFMFHNIDMDNRIQEIKQITSLFSHYEIKTAYKETSNQENLTYFNIDNANKKIIIFSKRKAGRGTSEKMLSVFKIFDIERQEIDYESEIYNQDLIGRLESGMYTFVGGHYYYNNNVIKIRYDLILGNPNVQYSVENILDTYLDIFILDPNERVRNDTPLNSYQSHRLAYIITDKSKEKSLRVLVVPYLHERRIYLNRLKPSTEYFYTTIETTYAAEQQYHNAVEKALQNGKEPSSVDIIGAMKPQAVVQKKSLSESLFNVNSGSMREQLKQDSFTTIVCVNLTSQKLYMYNQAGILLNRVVYQPLVMEYGEPLQVSNNGQMYIFKKSYEQIDEMAEKMVSKEKLLREYFTFTIIKMTVFGMQHVKRVNLLDSIEEYLQFQGGLFGQKSLQEFKQQNPWFTSTNFERAQNEIEFEFLVNDRSDFVVRIRNSKDFEEDQEGEETNHNTIYYYENFQKEKGNKNQVIEDVSGLYVSKNHRHTKFIFNRKYFYFWDDKSINYFFLEDVYQDINLKRVGFKIDPKDEKSAIRELRTGSQPMYVCIIVGNTQDADNVIIWDMDKDLEGESYEIEEDYLVVWDINGKPYIVTDSKAIFPEQRCAVTSYDYEGAIQRFKAKKAKLSVHKGHRVDGKNHNWLIFDEYITLPFSYMSFVIKDKIENEDPNIKGNLFDPVPYNYIYNRSTSFIDGDFVSNDHNQLAYVLEEMQKVDPNSLEIINYVRVQYDEDDVQKINSALHKAAVDGNQRSIDILLSFMSKIEMDSSRNYMEILPSMIDQLKFIDYYTHIPQRSHAMVKKQVIRANNTYNDRIVAMAQSSSIYVDQLFFRDSMNDTEKQLRSYPVSIISVKVGWLVNEPQGKDFLIEILNTPNMDIYKIESLIVIIEYLFMKYKGVIFVLVLPIYFFNFITFQFLISQLSTYYEDVLLKLGGEENTIEDSRSALLIQQIINGISLGLMGLQVINSIYQSGSRYFSNVYSYVDILFIASSVIIYVNMEMIKKNEETMTLEQVEPIMKLSRQIQVLGVIALYTKASYFLSLIDEIAPLIDIIKQIFYDIRYFLIVLFIYTPMFAQAFHYISVNQLQFDEIDEEDIESIDYNGNFNSMWYVTNMMIGNTNADGFSLGNQSQYYILITLFIFACFVIILHFMNMLIAIMGNTFAERREVGAQIMVKDHLRFVMDNWLLMNIAFRNKERIKYIIAAFQANDEDGDNILPEIKDTLKEMQCQMQDEFKKNMYSTREIHITCNDILKNMN